MRNIALDLGKKKTTYCEIKDGKVVRRATLKDLAELYPLLAKDPTHARVAFEACRVGWHLASELKALGHEPVMVDTTRVGRLGIGHHGRKTDEIDVDLLAFALDQDRIPRAHILSPHRQQIRCEQAVRRSLVETRAQYAAAAREMVRARGEKLAECEVVFFPVKFAQAELSEHTRKLIEPWVTLIATLNTQVARVEKKLMELCEQEGAVQLLSTVPGVSMIVATAFVSVVDEAKRFKKAHELESYLGLVPRENSSGGKQRLGAISKAGNTYLRSLLVQSAWSVLRQKADDDPLKMWGIAIAQKRGKRIAVVAVARRLAGILWAMWRDGRVYDPRVLATASTSGLVKAEECAKRRREAMATATKKMEKRKRLWARLLEGVETVSQSQP